MLASPEVLIVGFTLMGFSAHLSMACNLLCRLLCALSFLLVSSHGIEYGYRVTSVEEGHNGEWLSVLLELVAGNSYLYSPDIQQLHMSVSYETEDRLHVHITDISNERWEIPQLLIPRKEDYVSLIQPSSGAGILRRELLEDTTNGIIEHDIASTHELQFSFTIEPFGFAITRKATKEVLFNSTPGSAPFGAMLFKDQYLEISTVIPEDASLYGLGESTQADGFQLFRNRTYTLWTSDITCSTVDVDLYGAHPFYLDVRTCGVSHGVLLLNSNGMDIIYNANFLTYKVDGGILDFYFFAGPEPLSVVQQYTELVGRPAPIPYWSLGFHQSKYGYKSIEEVEAVVASYRAASIPLDVMWNDIDYMDHYKDFTVDPVNYPVEKLRAYVENLHANDQRYVLIVDPGIAVDKEYSTFRHGLEMDIFVKHGGKPYLAHVWPGAVYFPDFLHPNISSFWNLEISNFYKVIPFDGLWIDMNEVSNFCSGITCTYSINSSCSAATDQTKCCLDCTDDNPTRWDDPPYKINNAGSHAALGMKTMATSAVHYNGVLEYNAHNLYGLSEAIITNEALKSVLKRRPFLLSRSTFPGSGAHTAHWTGDNAATWNDLVYSIVGIFNSGLFGVPMVGADVCGFLRDTSEELCNRWIQVGAFYPFSRNHADLQSKNQELYLWDSVAHSARKALGLRYQLLPYLYTLAFEAHELGSPIARPLFFSFPDDPNTLGIDKQFLLGKGLLVSPVLTGGATSVTAYFPKGTWYNLQNFSQVLHIVDGSYMTLPAPWDTINVHLLGGIILPMQESALTTAASRKTYFRLFVAFPLADSNTSNSVAVGELFLDDGEGIEMKIQAGASTFVKFHSTRSLGGVHVTSIVISEEFALKKGWILNQIVFLGMQERSFHKSILFLNGKPISSSVSMQSHGSSSTIIFEDFKIPIGRSFHLYFNDI